MTTNIDELSERLQRRLCRELCAECGEPPCYEIDQSWLTSGEETSSCNCAALAAVVSNEVAEILYTAAMPCETKGVEDLEAGCCATCRARRVLAIATREHEDDKQS